MAITSLRFYKGSFPRGSDYTSGAIYFDNSTHQIRIGKGGTDSYDAFGGTIKDVTFADSKLTISFLDSQREDVVVDFSDTGSILASLSTRVGKVEEQVATLKFNIGSPATEGKEATGLFKKVEDAYNLADSKLGVIRVGSAIVNTGTDTEPNLNVKLSEELGNTLSIKRDGLYVNVPKATDYSVTIEESVPEGLIAKRYTLSQCGATIGTIDLPKDMVVSAGTVRKPTTEEVEEYGVSRDKDYIVLTLANVAVKPLIFIPTTDLVQVYTSGSSVSDPVVISIDENHRVTASITSGAIGVTYLSDDVKGVLEKAHTHANKTVLDSITEDKVTAWNAAAAAIPGFATSDKAGIVKIGSGSGLKVTTTDGSLSVDPDVYKVKDLSAGTGIKVTLKESGKHEIAVEIDNNTIKTTSEGKLYVDSAAIADIPIATEDRAGIVRGKGDIKVDVNGDMTLGWALFTNNQD